MLPKLLSADDVKKYLDIGDNLLYSLLRSKTFPAFKIGRSWKVPEDEFLIWINRQSRKQVGLQKYN